MQDIDACTVDFNCDSFDPENDQLRSLQSGQIVSKEVEMTCSQLTKMVKLK